MREKLESTRGAARALAAGLVIVGSVGLGWHPVGAATRATGPTPVRSWTDVRAKVAVSDVAFDAKRNLVIASIPASVPGLGNDVVELDPSTGALERSMYVGSNPGSLSVSSDGTILYVGLRGASRVVRVNLSTFTVASSFSTGSSGYDGPNMPGEVVAVPGQDNEVVVSLANPGFSSSFAGLALYRNGNVQSIADDGPDVENFAFGADPTTIYGYDNESSALYLSTWQLSDTALTPTTYHSGLVGGLGATITYAAPYLYSSNGSIADPVASTVVATLPVNGDAVLPMPAQNRAYYVSGSKLEEFRLDRDTLVSSKALAASKGDMTNPTSIVATNVGAAAVVGNTLHLLGPGVGPAASITAPRVRNHVTGLAGNDLRDLWANAVAYDPSRGRIVAAIASSSPTHANEIVEVDPATGAVGRHVFAGSDPAVLALSDDDSTLYVGLRGAPSVVQIDMHTLTVTTSFGLGSDPSYGAYYAAAIAVQPGAPDTIAVTRAVHELVPGLVGGVAVFDSGVMRQNVAAEWQNGLDSISFGSDPGTLYTSDLETSGEIAYKMEVDPLGVGIIRQVFRVGGSRVLGEVDGVLHMGCTAIDGDGNDLDLVGVDSPCMGGMDVASDRGYSIDAGFITELQLSTGRLVKRVGIASDDTNGSPVLVTKAGFATVDADGQGITLLTR